jgi:predicted 3-demethylubiquinone-9 3-methyltransferase (glyoxalase superfamily)
MPFLMFQGQAEEAMKYYTSLIEEAKILSLTRYGENETGAEGQVMQAVFSLKGQEFMCMDSQVTHAFTFTPSFSIFFTCETENEIDTLYESLVTDGQALMPLGTYAFSKKFGWLVDQFGVSWQLNLPHLK